MIVEGFVVREISRTVIVGHMPIIVDVFKHGFLSLQSMQKLKKKRELHHSVLGNSPFSIVILWKFVLEISVKQD